MARGFGAWVVAAIVGAALVVGLAYGAASLMEAASPEDDACIGCGLVLLMGVAAGLVVGVVVLAVGWSRRAR